MSLPTKENILREFPNAHYLETGTFRGDSIQQALDAGCFDIITGLEISYEQVRFCKNRFDLYFNSRSDLRIFEADTATDLAMHIGHLPKEQGITFFLDSHWQMEDGTDKGKNPFPLLKELEQIARTRDGNDTIIIDDFLYLTHPDVTGWSKGQVLEAIRKINPKYNIRLTSNPIINNLLIAIP